MIDLIVQRMMGMVGIEPTLPFGNRFLRPARLPVPPRPLEFKRQSSQAIICIAKMPVKIIGNGIIDK
jgi:hypothetical protein